MIHDSQDLRIVSALDRTESSLVCEWHAHLASESPTEEVRPRAIAPRDRRVCLPVPNNERP